MIEEKPPRPKQKPIHYLVFLIIGGVMATISKIILLQKNSEHEAAMNLFFYIGIIFLITGLIKLLVKKYKEGSFSKTETKIAENLAGQDAIVLGKDSRTRARYEQRIQERKIVNQGKNEKPQIITCPVCKTKNYSTSNYCHMCGAKLN